jgi:hypothetical protein
VTSGSAAACDVVSRLDRLDEPRDVLGRVLQIAVHRHDDPAARAGEPRMHGRMLADIALEPHSADVRVAVVDPLERRERPVRRPVVDVEHLVRPAERRQGRRQAPLQLLERRALLEERHDDGELGHASRVALPHRGFAHVRLAHREPEGTPPPAVA